MQQNHRICHRAALLCLLVFALTLFAGCGTSAQPAEQPTAPPQSTATPAPETTAVPEATAEPEAPTATPNPVDVELTEEDYARLIEDLISNPESYLEKTIRLSGLYLTEQPDGFDFSTHYVYRISSSEDEDIGDGDAAFLGLQFIPPEGFTAENDDWICVEGTFRPVTLDGYPFFALDDVHAVVDNEHRGAEIVMDLH